MTDRDGTVELWFDDIEGFNAFANSASYKNVIQRMRRDSPTPPAASTSSQRNTPSSSEHRHRSQRGLELGARIDSSVKRKLGWNHVADRPARFAVECSNLGVTFVRRVGLDNRVFPKTTVI
jgi:hypothetical protein